MFLNGNGQPRLLLQVICILVGVDNFYCGKRKAVSDRMRFLTENDIHACAGILRDANTVVLIIGGKGQARRMFKLFSGCYPGKRCAGRMFQYPEWQGE